MKIAFFATKPYDMTWFDSLSKEYEIPIKYYEYKLSEETISFAKGYDAVCAFVNDDINANVVNALIDMKVKAILLRCAGYNNVDLKAVETSNGKIHVLHVPSYSPEAVAEFSMALLLTVNRQTHRAYSRTRDFNMNINGLMGHDLNGKIVGIVGTGKIGQAMVRICKGFGMHVLAYDLYPNTELDVEYVSMEELFEKSDVISLHCPLTKATKHLICEKTLEQMKDGVFIINTSRGALIRTGDLINALLKPGKIGGVGLDVYEEEGELFYEDNSNDIVQDEVLARLMTFPNVIVTSHQGYFTEEAMYAIASVTMENANAVDKGLELVNEVKN